LICNPCNPTGRVFTQQERESIVEFASKHKLFLIVDEVYRNFVYDGNKETSFLEFAQEYDNVIVIDSLSKRYSVTGARVGALITSNKEVLETSLKLAQARLASGTLDQLASAHMVRNCPQSDLDAIVVEYQHRRDVLYENLQSIPGVFCHKPEGAFYTVVKLPVHNAEHFAQWLLESFTYEGATTFVAPARGFYVTPEKGLNEVRIAYVLHGDAIKNAVQVIKEALKVYKEN
jgi:aspartate aminotransferase